MSPAWSMHAAGAEARGVDGAAQINPNAVHGRWRSPRRRAAFRRVRRDGGSDDAQALVARARPGPGNTRLLPVRRGPRAPGPGSGAGADSARPPRRARAAHARSPAWPRPRARRGSPEEHPARHQTEGGHQTPRGGGTARKSTSSARRIMAPRVSDPPEAAQPPDRLAVGRLLGERGDLLVQLGLVGERLLEGEQAGVEGPLQRGQLEPLGADPGPVALPPVRTGDESRRADPGTSAAADASAGRHGAHPPDTASGRGPLPRPRPGHGSPSARRREKRTSLAASRRSVLIWLTGPARGQCRGDHLTGRAAGGDLSERSYPETPAS